MPNPVAEAAWWTLDRSVEFADYLGDILTLNDPVQQVQLSTGERPYRVLAVASKIEALLDKGYDWSNKKRNG